MYSRPRSFRRIVAVAILLWAFAPYAAQAEKDVDDQQTDHSNQDMGQPDLTKVPYPGDEPGIWDGPKSHPDLGEPGGALDPLFIGGVESPFVGHLASRLDPNELLLPLWAAPDWGPVPRAPLGPGERLADWSLPLGGSDGLPDLGPIGNAGWGPPAPIPEPGTLSLLVLGGALVAAGRRRGG